MSRVWFTSDHHIGHAKIAQIRATNAMITRVNFFDNEQDEKFCIDWHDHTLAWMWDSMIAPEDVVWVLGDISSGTKTAQLNALDWFRARPGEKHLIAGNHDGCHPMHRDAHKWLPVYLDGAFESVQMASRRRLALPEGHVDGLLSHFPYRGDHTNKQRYTQWRLPDLGKDYVLHGHVHSQKKIYGGRQIHIGVDAWGLKPVALEQVLELVFRTEGVDE